MRVSLSLQSPRLPCCFRNRVPRRESPTDTIILLGRNVFHSNELCTKLVFTHEYGNEHRKQQASTLPSVQPHTHSPSSDAAGDPSSVGATSAGEVGDLNSCCVKPHRQKLEARSLCCSGISQLALYGHRFLVAATCQVHCKRKKQKNISPNVSLGVHVFLLLDFCFCLRR